MEATESHLVALVDQLITATAVSRRSSVDQGEATTSQPSTTDRSDDLVRLLCAPRPVLDDEPLLDLTHAVVRLRNLADSLLARAAATLDRAGVARRRRDSVTAMLVEFGLPPVVAGRALRVGRGLADLPAVESASVEARLSGEHAAAIVNGVNLVERAVGGLDAEGRRKLSSELLAQAVIGVPADLSKYARKRALQLVPPDGPTPVSDNRELNEVSLNVGEDGRTHGELDLDVLVGEKLRVALDPLMTPVPLPDGSRDPRSAAQRRADGFEQIIETYLANAQRPRSGGVLPTLVVTASLDVLAANGGSAARRGGVATVDGGQPVTPIGVSKVACDASIVALFTDAHDVPLQLKREQRFVTPGLRRALIARDRGCAFPGCGRPPSWCHGHHAKHWANGGNTDLDNIVLLCQLHHTTVHETGWEVKIGGDRYPWFRKPGHKMWIRSHARRTMTIESTAAA